MKEATDLGKNRTGISTSPVDSKKLISSVEEAVEMPPSSGGFAVNETALFAVKRAYIEDADPVGSVPPPISVKGLAKTLIKTLRGERASVLVDKLGERLAFERSGTRLYEAFLIKLTTLGEQPGGPTIAEATEIMNDELRHFHMVREVIEQMGGDPTAMTPSADAEAVAAAGICQLVVDPRTGVRECVQALLHAELADNDGWELLIELCEELGEDDIAARFDEALASEIRHLEQVRSWLRALTLGADSVMLAARRQLQVASERQPLAAVDGEPAEEPVVASTKKRTKTAPDKRAKRAAKKTARPRAGKARGAAGRRPRKKTPARSTRGRATRRRRA
jgi:hypothetical protein